MRYVALLRAVNLAGIRKVPMAKLREVIEGRGFTDVETVVQSGNVVFNAPRMSAARLAGDISGALEAEFGFPVPTIVRTSAQLDRVIADNPFPAGVKEPKLLHVAFASSTVRAASVADIDPEPFAPEEFRVGRAEVYLWFPNGAGRAKMKVDFEKLMGVTMTSRNWNTVTKLGALASAP